MSGTVSFVKQQTSVVKQRALAPDGRAARWEEHNLQRRRDLVESTLRAIRVHGAGVGMDEIAAMAGTSKTVVYRHFGGRTGLYRAVVESVHAYIATNVMSAVEASKLDPADLVRTLTDVYLGLVERDPEIYRFVVTRPTGEDPVEDPVTGITGRIGDELADIFRAWLSTRGLDPRPANTWGHGVVGFVWAVADKWITTGHQRPRADIVDFTGRLFAPAFAAHASAGAPAPDLLWNHDLAVSTSMTLLTPGDERSATHAPKEPVTPKPQTPAMPDPSTRAQDLRALVAPEPSTRPEGSKT